MVEVREAATEQGAWVSQASHKEGRAPLHPGEGRADTETRTVHTAPVTAAQMKMSPVPEPPARPASLRPAPLPRAEPTKPECCIKTRNNTTARKTPEGTPKTRTTENHLKRRLQHETRTPSPGPEPGADMSNFSLETFGETLPNAQNVGFEGPKLTTMSTPHP